MVVTKYFTVQELLADSKRFTKSAYARSNHGTAVASESSYAACWCLLGAVMKVYSNDLRQDVVKKLLTVLDRRGLPSSIALYNDNHTHAEVLELAVEAGI